MERLSKYCNPLYPCSILNSTIPQPPRDTFGGKHCFPGSAENEYSRTALASKFSVLMERLSKYCNPQYPCSILNSTIPQPPYRDTFGRKHCFPGVAGNEYSWPALASKFSVAMERLSKYWIPNTHVVYSTVRSRNPPRDTFGSKHCFPGVAGNEHSRTALASFFFCCNGKIEQIL